jgi:hypothetical protein
MSSVIVDSLLSKNYYNSIDENKNINKTEVSENSNTDEIIN